MCCIPKVSVLVPIYNTARYLRQCLDSVVNQTLQEMEIICINDGSIDDSLDIVKEYAKKDTRIHIIDKVNTGYGHSMNIGLLYASGEYIGIVESDDSAQLDMFESLYNAGVRYDAEMVVSNFYRQSAGKDLEQVEALKEFPYYEVLNADMYPQLYFAYIPLWSRIYARSFLLSQGKKLLFNETPGASYQDVYFSFSTLYCAKKVVCVPGAYLQYRIDNEGSSVSSADKVYAIFEEYQSINHLIEHSGEQDQLLMHMLSAYKFKDYMYGPQYLRIADVYKFAFLLKVQEEYNKEEEKGWLCKAYWDEQSWSLMQLIRKNPEAYLKQYCEDYIYKHRICPYTIYSDVYKKGLHTLVLAHENVIIYGAGAYGRKVEKILKKYGKAYLFAVTEEVESDALVDEVPIKQLSDLSDSQTNSLVLVAVKHLAQKEEMVRYAHALGFVHILPIDQYFLDL